MSDGRDMQTRCHCCWCVSGVFCTLLGIILLSTGVCMILDYGAFDVSTLPPGWQSSDGQRNLGIILTCVAFAILIVGVLVSVLFFTVCSKTSPVASPVSDGSSNKDFKSSVPEMEVVPNEKLQSELPDNGVGIGAKHKHKTHRQHSKSKSKHRVKKSRKPLETHHEDPEEIDGMQLKEMKRRSSVAPVVSSEKTNFQPSPTKATEDNFQFGKTRNGSVDADDFRVPNDIGLHTRLPPVLKIAPAIVVSCNITEDKPEPEVFRIDGTSLSSDDSSSIPASTSTALSDNTLDSTACARESPKEATDDQSSPREITNDQRRQLDRELSSIGLLR